eukprot:1161525-Pelagomonas_calceolata.AAC.22
MKFGWIMCALQACMPRLATLTAGRKWKALRSLHKLHVKAHLLQEGSMRTCYKRRVPQYERH